MKHLGDITLIQGSKVPLVDIVCGGSPCQDLSVAGGSYGGVRNNSDTVGALCARDYKGVGNQYVNEGKCIIQQTNNRL